jgi:hypothetical protein
MKRLFVAVKYGPRPVLLISDIFCSWFVVPVIQMILHKSFIQETRVKQARILLSFSYCSEFEIEIRIHSLLRLTLGPAQRVGFARTQFFQK